ncbi:hypothetical protein DS843_13680 [Roseomonas genomospecies 6]|uniref:Hsp70 family protein n=2 Tax=Roseomonas genomospecies 6 TaxID=214106 RepID=A0A9W7TY07_9PROT|nr:hypothetical protein DS843_13680 [Roseomonas genomospecies 6]
MVVDAGAGTTDFAMFQAMGLEGGGFKYGLLKPTVRMSRIAGNAVDAIVLEEMFRVCGIDPITGRPRTDDDFRYLLADARNQVRDVKRDVFMNGFTEIVLKPNAEGVVQREAIMSHAKYQQYILDLTRIRDSIVDAAVDSQFAELIADRNLRQGPALIRVVLTGGSAALPLIRNLASGEIEVKGARFKFGEIEVLPGWVNRLERDMSQLVASGFAQSAVAIGGAVPVLPEELRDLRAVVSPALPGKRVLERYPVKGV